MWSEAVTGFNLSPRVHDSPPGPENVFPIAGLARTEVVGSAPRLVNVLRFVAVGCIKTPAKQLRQVKPTTNREEAALLNVL